MARGKLEDEDGIDGPFERRMAVKPRRIEPTEKQLELAYRRASAAESAAIAALPEPATKAQTDRCWALAEATNAAMRALHARRGH